MVVYVAKDNSGLTSTCSFEFEVEGRLNINKVDEVDIFECRCFSECCGYQYSLS